MTENQPPEPAPVAYPILPQPAPPAPAAQPARTPLKDRVLGMRGVAGVAAASLILGGVGGAALGAVSDGGDEGRFRGGPNGLQGGFPGQQQQPPGVLGQQPGRPQDDDD